MNNVESRAMADALHCSPPAHSHAAASRMPAVTLSVVSHGHRRLVEELFADLRSVLVDPGAIEVVLTLNRPEPAPIAVPALPFDVTVIRNERPRGFGTNHNAAFERARGRYFGVLNPDVRLSKDPFGPLIRCLDEEPDVAVAAPQVVSPDGRIQDSARKFPTPLSILAKLFRNDLKLDYPADGRPFRPDWTAGMFMLFESDAYRAVGGFDERYFLYYEDVDICARLRRVGKGVMVTPDIKVTHEGDRRSRRDLRYFGWHLASMARYFRRYPLGGPK